MFAKLKRLISRATSLLMLFQKTPVVQIVLPQGNLLATAAAVDGAAVVITSIVGLGAYDSVAGATTLNQVFPTPGSTTVALTQGQSYAGASAPRFQVTGSPSPPSSWSISSGSLPTGMTLENNASSITFVTGTPASAGNHVVAIRAWELDNFSGRFIQKTFTFSVAAGGPATVTSHPASTTIFSGNTATLTVSASGAQPLTFQWYQGTSGVTTTPVGTNSASFTTPALATTTNYWVRVTNSTNPTGADSNTATVTVLTPAGIVSQPVPTTITAGQTATLTVGAVGDAPLTYEWYEGETGSTDTAVGTNSASFTTPELFGSTKYWVRVSNAVNPDGVDSNTADVTVLQPPVILSEPNSGSVFLGYSTTLSVSAAGEGPLTYQWYQGQSGDTATPVGTNSPNFTTPNLNSTTSYWVKVSNTVLPAGVNSATATITVLLDTPPWVHTMSEIAGPIVPTTRGEPNATWFGWDTFNDAGMRAQPISDNTPDIGTPTTGATFATTNGQDHVLEDGEFSFTSGALAEQIVIPTDGVVGTDGFTTLLLQIVAPFGSGPFPGTISVSSLNGAAPDLVQGVNDAGDGQLWAKWELTGNQASYTINLTATSGGFSFDQVVVDTAFSLAGFIPDAMAAAPPSVTNASPLPLGVIGVGYNLQLVGTGGVPPYEFLLNGGALPAGITLSGAGLVAGTATSAGTANFTVLIRDADLRSGTRSLSLVTSTLPNITTAAALPRAFTGASYSQALAATGGTAPYQWSVSSGTLSAGLTLTGAGVLAGTPTTAGDYSFTIQVQDANGLTDQQTFTVEFSNLAIATANLMNAVKNVAYSASLSASGGTPPFAWTLTAGSLPPGFSPLSGAGVLSGTPTVAGNSTFTVTVTDADNFTVSKQFTLTVSDKFIAPIVNPITFPQVMIGTEFNYTVTALNYPKTFAITGLPKGLKFTAATGAITGRSDVSGVFNIQVKATNTGGTSPVVTAPLTVRALPKMLLGSFGGLIGRGAPVNSNLGGFLTVTTTSNGGYTVKATSALAGSGTKGGSATYSATGRLAAAAPHIEVPLGGQALTLSFDLVTGAMTGTLGSATVTGWRSFWHATANPADNLFGYYSFAFDLTNPADQITPTIPQGTGYATFAVTLGGTLVIAGKTGDGEAVTTTTFLGSNGEFWLYTPLYKNLGSIQGQLSLTEDANGLFTGNLISGPLTWFKPLTATKSYPAPFGPVNLTAAGAYLAPANKGNVLLGLPESGGVQLRFFDGGLDESETDPDTDFNYTSDNKIVPPAAASNPAKTTLTVNANNGAVGGSFTLVETTPKLSRKVNFSGQVVRFDDTTVKAVGWFMLPQIPAAGQTAANAPSLSGSFTLAQPSQVLHIDPAPSASGSVTPASPVGAPRLSVYRWR